MPPRSQKEITTALTSLAFVAGNYRAAANDLKKQGISLTPDTLKNWATNSHVEEYERIKNTLKESYEEEAIANMRNRIKEADEAESLAIQRTLDTLFAEDNPAKAAQAAYYLSTVKKNNIEKMRLMMDRPTEIIEERSPEAALKSLMTRGILKPVEN